MLSVESYRGILYLQRPVYIFCWQVNSYDHVHVIAAAHSAPFFISVKAEKGQRNGADAGNTWTPRAQDIERCSSNVHCSCYTNI